MNTKEIIKETILDLLDEHSADEITVKLICMESGLSKQTLYNHYHNWMDALADAYEGEFYGSVGDCDTYIDWVQGFYRVLNFLHTRKKAFLHIYNSSRREELIEIIDDHGPDHPGDHCSSLAGRDANDEQTVTTEKGWQYSGIVNWSKGTEKRFCAV